MNPNNTPYGNSDSFYQSTGDPNQGYQYGNQGNPDPYGNPNQQYGGDQNMAPYPEGNQYGGGPQGGMGGQGASNVECII